MNAADVISLVRTLVNEPNPNQRWTDQQILQYISLAQKIIVREVLFPVARYVFQTVANAQEYQVKEILEIKEVYIQGQPIVRSDKATLQGDQIMFYDQTGSGGGPGGLITPGSAPVLAGGQFTPQWTSQPPETYPVASQLGYPAAVASPWFAGRRPVYYFDGGLIGFVPAPAGVYPVVVDCVAEPQTVFTTNDALILPSIALDAIAWKVIEYITFGNAEQNASADQRNYAQTEYAKALASVRGWARGYDGKSTKGPKPLTYRSFYTLGNNRNWGWNS